MCSTTLRRFARTAIHTRGSAAAAPGYSASSGGPPRTDASGPSTARMMSATVSSVARLGEAEPALGAAVAAHDPGVPELAEDVLQEVERDALRVRDPLGLDRLLVSGSRQLDGCAYGVVGFGRDSHGVSVTPRVGVKP